MTIFRRLFPTAQERRAAELARQMIEDLRESRKPVGCARSAEWGADIRDRLLTLADQVEKDTGKPAIVFAADGRLINPALIEALSKLSYDGEILRLSIGSCFVHPQETQNINETWPTTVKQYHGRPNSDEVIHEKATLLAGFVAHNLNVTVEACEQLKAAGFQGVEQTLTEEQELLVKCEEAALWYRSIDEYAYALIREFSSLFVDYFLDTLTQHLGLQGASPKLICRTMVERSKEYAQYREWTADVDRMAGTLLWNASKHVGGPFGLECHLMFTMLFGTLFLMREKRALVYEFLTGNEKKK
jgi:hypothetical protein